MDSSKGKGRETQERDLGQQSQAADSSKSDSLLSKVAASASGLARSTWTAPSAAEIQDQAASSLANASKGQGSSASSSTTWAQQSTSGSVRQGPTSTAAFRSEISQDQVLQNEGDFAAFLDTVSPLDVGNNSIPEITAPPLGASEVTAGEGLQSRAYASIAEQEARDGEDVVALLSYNAHGPDAIFEPPPPEDVDWDLSADQLAMIRSIARELFPGTSTTTWNQHAPSGDLNLSHPLNLNPYLNSAENDDTSVLLGEHLPPHAAHEAWIDRWADVLSRYQDEVWGDLLPVVKAAQTEIAEAKDGGGDGASGEMKAVRRLGLILGHIQRR